MMVNHTSGTTMTEPNLEVPAELRELAEKTIDQAERAFDLFFDAARRSSSTAPMPVQELSKLVLAFWEESLKTSFEYARKLALTSSLQEAANVQAELVKQQIGNAQRQRDNAPGRALPGSDLSSLTASPLSASVATSNMENGSRSPRS
jgi:Phasin protein